MRRLRPRPGRADLVVGRVGRQLVAIPEHEQYEHLLLVAPTGAGKTSSLIIPNLLAEPGTRSLVITDPKRELLRTTSPRLRAVYGDGRVWVLDLLDPTISQGYNPLAYVRDAATADLFAQTWVRNTGTSKEPFWDNAARTLIGAAALHLVLTEDGVPPLASLVELLCGSPAGEIKATLAGSAVPEVRRLARGFLTNMEKNERLLGSVFTELPPRFACLNLPEVRRTTSLNEIDLARLAAEPTALYLALDLGYSKTLAPLTACFFTHLFTTLAEIAKAAPSGALPTPTLAYLDEFGTIGHIPEFQARMATVRSAGIGCLLVVQDRAQLVKAYGDEDADTILTNATTKLCLARVTHDDAAYFSKLAGTTTVHATNRGSTRPLLLPWADRGSRGVGEVSRPLITPDELTTMGDEVLVAGGGHRPIRARQRRYYRDRALQARVPGPAGPDPLAHFRERRRRALLPTPDLSVPLPAAAQPSTTGAGPVASRGAGSPLPVAEASTLPPVYGVAIPQAAAPPVSAAGAPPSVAGAPATLSCTAAPGPAGAPPSSPAAPVLPRSPVPAASSRASGVERAEGRLALTAGERRLLEVLAATGRPGREVSSTELAARLGLKRSTVRDVLSKLRRKLGVDQSADLAQVARERGLLDRAPATAD